MFLFLTTKNVFINIEFDIIFENCLESNLHFGLMPKWAGQNMFSFCNIRTLLHLLSLQNNFKMNIKIQNSANCVVRSIIRFLLVINYKLVEIHRLLCEVYADGIMIKRRVKQWYIMFIKVYINVHDEDHSDRSTFLTDDLTVKVDEKIQ